MPGCLFNRRVVLAGAAEEAESGGGGVDLPPVNITPPVVSGTAIVDGALDASGDTWQYPVTNKIWTWKQDGGTNCTGTNWSSTGDTPGTYVPNAADIGYQLYVEVVAQNSAGESSPVDSNLSDSVGSDTDLSSFTVDGVEVIDNQTVSKDFGTSSAVIAATTEDALATLTIAGMSGSPQTVSLSTGDNSQTVTATAADTVTTRDYHVNVHVLDEGLPEITQVTFADSSVTGSILISSKTSGVVVRRALWMNVDGGGSQPDLSGQGVTAYTEIPVNSADSGVNNANTFTGTVNAASIGVAAAADGAVVTLTDNDIGPRTDAALADFPGGLTLSITQQGRNPQ